MLTEIKSLAIVLRSRVSALDECTYNINKLFNLDWVIVLCKKVLILRRDEKNRSAVAVVTGRVM